MAGAEDALSKIQRAKRDEERRVTAMIERDRGEAARERMRKDATLEVSEGNFVHLDDTVVEPTPEWLGKGDTERFTPKAPDGTVRSVSTVRRVKTPIADRLHRRGKITDDQHAACAWYRDQWEAARLDGRYKSNHLSLSGNTGGGGGGMAQAPMAATIYEAEARAMIRAARDAITPMYLRFLDAVVIDNIPLGRACRFAKCPERKVDFRFRQVSQELYDFIDKSGIELKFSTGDGE